MNRSITYFFFSRLYLLFFFLPGFIQAQKKCFEQTAYYAGANTFATLSQVNVRIPSINQNSYTGIALSGTLSADAEYALLPWLSLGIGYGRTRYLTSRTEQLNAWNVFPVLGIHLIPRKNFDLAININYGYSSVSYHKNDQYLNSARGNGRTTGITLSPRFFPTKRFCFSFDLGFQNNRYPQVDFYNKINNINDILLIEGGGVFFGIGIRFRLGHIDKPEED